MNADDAVFEDDGAATVASKRGKLVLEHSLVGQYDLTFFLFRNRRGMISDRFGVHNSELAAPIRFCAGVACETDVRDIALYK